MIIYVYYKPNSLHVSKIMQMILQYRSKLRGASSEMMI